MEVHRRGETWKLEGVEHVKNSHVNGHDACVWIHTCMYACVKKCIQVAQWVLSISGL